MQDNPLDTPISKPPEGFSVTPWVASQDAHKENLNYRGQLLGGEYHDNPVPDMVYLTPTITLQDLTP